MSKRKRLPPDQALDLAHNSRAPGHGWQPAPPPIPVPAPEIRGAEAMADALAAIGQLAVADTDSAGRGIVFVFFSDGSTLELQDYDSADWEYQMLTPDGDGYGGSRDITGQDILDMVANESAQRGVPAMPHCDQCGHRHADHAFFPDGSAAPLCAADYKPEDRALLDHNCDCEGYISPDVQAAVDEFDRIAGSDDYGTEVTA